MIMNLTTNQINILTALQEGTVIFKRNRRSGNTYEGFPVGRGRAMASLFAQGILTLGEPRKSDGYQRVRLTQAGRKALKSITVSA